MTLAELIKTLTETAELTADDSEIGISFNNGWSSIKDLTIESSSLVLLNPEDQLYDDRGEGA